MAEQVELRSLEGHRVGMALIDGSRIDECQLISAPRHGAHTVWVVLGDCVDTFIPLAAIIEVWEVAGSVSASTDPSRAA